MREQLTESYKILSLNPQSECMRIMEKFDRYISTFPKEDTKQLLRLAVAELLINIHSDASARYDGVADINDMVEQILRYIDDNLTEIKDIDELCNESFISKSYLHKLFKKYMFTTPKQYIAE